MYIGPSLSRLKLALSLVLLSLGWTAAANALTLQQQIDALPSTGGQINLPCGSVSDTAVVNVKGNVSIIGSGACTSIPPIKNNTGGRIYNVLIENLQVDVNLIPDTNAYYGIDFRDVSTSHVRNVWITDSGASHNRLLIGVLLYTTGTGGCFYNSLENVSADAYGVGSAGVEIDFGANQNTIIGGILSGETGLKINSSDGTTVIGTSLEQRTYAMSWCRNWVPSASAVPGTTLQGVRCELSGYGPVWYTGCIGGSSSCLAP